MLVSYAGQTHEFVRTQVGDAPDATTSLSLKAEGCAVDLGAMAQVGVTHLDTHAAAAVAPALVRWQLLPLVSAPGTQAQQAEHCQGCE